MSIGLYIHIPFCKQKCLYCDFPSFANLEYLSRLYIDALCREISEQGVLFIREEVDTVYIGGGTPTVLSIRQIDKIITALSKSFTILPNAEISIEANPGTIDKINLKDLRQMGINRISFGIQSFSDNILTQLGRIHTAAEGVASVKDAQKVGFNNINIDLMFGLPGQQIREFQATVRQALALEIQHISAYGLKIEEGTAFARLQEQKKLFLPAEEIEEAMYDFITEYLPLQGFHRYEISNFALTNQQCKHNLKYWHYEPYIGLGSAAHSFVLGQRKANCTDVQEYIDAIRKGISPVCYQEKIDNVMSMAEFVFLGLRTTEGVLFESFQHYFGMSLLTEYELVVKKLLNQQLIMITKERMFLTAQGMKFGNQVFEKFLPD